MEKPSGWGSSRSTQRQERRPPLGRTTGVLPVGTLEAAQTNRRFCSRYRRKVPVLYTHGVLYPGVGPCGWGGRAADGLELFGNPE